MDEIDFQFTFGEWLKHRRKKLDLTLAELAERAGCSVSALRKIESGERRPSKQLAALFTKSLEIPPEDQGTFIKVARGELNLERLPISTRAPSAADRLGLKPRSSTGNLPEMLIPFVGRELEMASLSHLLYDPQCRLLTLVGPGGIGKTRLAIEAAARHQDAFPDGVWFVSLAPLNSPAFLVPAVADALDFRFQDPAKPQEQLLNYLHSKRALLVLDNVEHLLDGVGLFAEILKSSPQVKLLGTSRERLNLLSEWVFEIQGLPVPPDEHAERFEEYSSVALFLQSARRVQAGFELGNEDQRWVARICQIVEGMPLGIELAAAWVGLLSCEEIAREIEYNLDFLASSLRDLPERHRSLRATLDHSWNLLNAEEKSILSRLSVFRGSFSREAAEEICEASLPILSSLKNKSLLYRTDSERYELHELIRQYAVRRLAEDPIEDERIKDQHALYFARRLAMWEKALQSSLQVETLSSMAHEIDDLRQAWQRMVTCCEFDCRKNMLFSPGLFHSSLFSLSLFYEMRSRNWEAIGVFGESVEFLKTARDVHDAAGNKLHREAFLGHAMAYLGLHKAYLLQYREAREYLEEALKILEYAQAAVVKAQAQVMLAWICRVQGQIQKAAHLLEQSLIIFREENEVWWYTLTLNILAAVYLSLGKIDESNALYQEGLRLAEPGDLRLRVPLLNDYGYASYMQGDYEGAERILEENLNLSFQLGNKRQTAYVYQYLGQIALATNRIELAEANFQECVDLLSEFGESHDLAVGLIHLGKCLTARRETEAAREKFLQVIRIGQSIDIFYLIYWGWVNLARIYMQEDQMEKALEMAVVLQQYPVEYKPAQEDEMNLLADLQAGLSSQQAEAALARAEGKKIESFLDLI
jgi:predicted ATPase/DNA-binding XRE family transcriptional regulator